MSRATVDLSADIHIYGIWFVPGGNKDWMASLSKKDGEPWKLHYRFRYYRDDLAFDSDDIKSGYTATAVDDSDESRDRLLGCLKTLVPMTEQNMGNPADFLLLDCRGDDPKVFFEFGSRPWSNIKMLSREEAIAQGYEVPDDDNQPHGSDTAPETGTPDCGA
jgi:hypothetical protein